ncbi:MAG: methyltransferase domain-containing protein, partial [Geobacteraceae bacterium]|nr:methyltransferase domain-containing protein [Geobacteraceae bacterium]
MRIAIVCYRYSIEVSPTVKNMATYFAEKGYSVSIFVDRLYRSTNFSLPGVNLLIFDHCTEQEAAQRRDTEETREAFSQFLKPQLNEYDLLVGVEFTSLHLSVQAGADPGKFLYLSLEGIDLLRHSDSTYVGALLAACRLLVVQSKERGDALTSYLGRDLPFFHLPVSLRPVRVKPGTDKSSSLKLLYSGYFAPWACMEEFMNSFQKSHAFDFCSLTLHGHSMGTKEYESLISHQIELTPGASIDTRYFSDNEYSDYLGGFDAGLALYKDLTGTGNFENLIFSSGKIASYLWHGLAVITTIDHEMTRRPPFVRLLSWSPSGLHQSLKVISDNLAQFKTEARKYAVRYFNFDTYMDSLLNTLVSKHSDSTSITIFTELLRANIIHPGQPLRLHLGCGQKYLQGYINIDFPSENHTTQSRQIADYCANILDLDFPPGSVDEIRCHHVLEHFERPVALSLLAQWQSWLKKEGTLVIETPDLEESARLLLSEQSTYQEKQVIIRHLFGSNEAHWAV